MATVGADAQVHADPLTLTWADVLVEVGRMCARHYDSGIRGVFGVPTGGSVVALHAATLLKAKVLDAPEPGCLVVDDLVDSGRTLRPYLSLGHEVDALYRKPHSPGDLAPQARTREGWLKFPWEHETGAEENVVRLLEYVGEDPTREGLLETPARYLKAIRELTGGYGDDPAAILSRVFEEQHDEMVVVRGIHSWSVCEHHVLPFRLEATVGYLPSGRILGLSKVARLVHCYARRLQVQERLTEQVAKAIAEHLRPLGVGVVVRGWHTCMAMRGVKTDGEMVTSCLLGALREDPRARSEFLSLARER
jgi:GTP cyclohydrolase IA